MPTPFNIQTLICSAHRLIEINEGGARITTAELSKRMKISPRTLTEYERGTNHPTSMRALLLLLAQLRDDQIVHMVRQYEVEVSLEVGAADDC
ncbi:helix-turn-helix transcriptional regulator [Janthinobacterium sp. YR213]|uniref:helix-turn-helix domain-containing protein n=1 Tax=Janthinobacterium sp. YR213 TaxID=1881027 RepID=UPI00088D636B|nr:helix-turn-helix transcriptional regulator [Janthinobacterium sp. YR213]SDG77114.1 Helix-turn-helix [Janthinobacterium sp. YR213]